MFLLPRWILPTPEWQTSLNAQLAVHAHTATKAMTDSVKTLPEDYFRARRWGQSDNLFPSGVAVSDLVSTSVTCSTAIIDFVIAVWILWNLRSDDRDSDFILSHISWLTFTEAYAESCGDCFLRISLASQIIDCHCELAKNRKCPRGLYLKLLPCRG